MKSIFLMLLSVSLILCPWVTFGQGPLPSATAPPMLNSKILSEVDQRLSHATQFFNRKTKHYLKKIQKQEAKIKRKLSQKDSLLSVQLFPKASQLQGNNAISYNGHLDSLKTALSYLGSAGAACNAYLDKALNTINGSQSALNLSEEKEKMLHERITLLKEKLSAIGVGKQLKVVEKQVSYYKQQVDGYKQLLSSPKKLEAKLLSAIAESQPFKKFFNKYSTLATLFRLPTDLEENIIQGVGMQTRQALNAEVRQRMGLGADPNQFVNIETSKAQLKLNEFKEKIKSVTGNYNTAEDNAPKTNPEKKKSFLNRLEYATNLQNTPSNNFFPMQTDVGIHVAYRLNRKWKAGVGGAGKIGWGKNWRNIVITGQGLAIRSFCEFDLLGNISGTAGLEYNYAKPFDSYQHLKNLDHWTQSGLIGLSRTIPISRNGNKNNKITLLWDFLSYQQVPRTPALKLRLGYSIQ